MSRQPGSPVARKMTRRPTFPPKLDVSGQSAAARSEREFDARAFLATIGEGRTAKVFRRRETIYAQGEAADAIFYLQKGKVRLAVIAESGKEATLGILSQGNFFGEGSLAGQSLRMGSAS